MATNTSSDQTSAAVAANHSVNEENTPVKISDFSGWGLVKNSISSTHAKTFYITLADSTFLLLQLVYSTMNSWSHSVQATLRIYPGPDSKSGAVKKAKTVGLGAGDFHVSKDGLSVDTGTLKIECLQGGAKYRLFYHDEEGGLGMDAIFVVGRDPLFCILVAITAFNPFLFIQLL